MNRHTNNWQNKAGALRCLGQPTIASGEVATVLLADTPRDMLIDWLCSNVPANAHPSLQEGIIAVIAALEEARQREG